MTISFKRFLITLLLSLLTTTLLLTSPVFAAEDVSYLLTSASKGDLAGVNAMLSSGANPNVKDEDGLTEIGRAHV